MRNGMFSVIGLRPMVCLLTMLLCFGCTKGMDPEEAKVKASIMRYNQLLADGYRTMNMTPVQEVATEDQATKLYAHMAALSEGELKMDSTLKGISFEGLDIKQNEAVVRSKETWDFTHLRILSGEKYAQERDFIYRMEYRLRKEQGRWMVTGVSTLDGTSTNAVIPWPKVARNAAGTSRAGGAQESGAQKSGAQECGAQTPSRIQGEADSKLPLPFKGRAGVGMGKIAASAAKPAGHP